MEEVFSKITGTSTSPVKRIAPKPSEHSVVVDESKREDASASASPPMATSPTGASSMGASSTPPGGPSLPSPARGRPMVASVMSRPAAAGSPVWASPTAMGTSRMLTAFSSGAMSVAAAPGDVIVEDMVGSHAVGQREPEARSSGQREVPPPLLLEEEDAVRPVSTADAKVALTRIKLPPSQGKLFPELPPPSKWGWLGALFNTCRRLSSRKRQVAMGGLTFLTITIQGVTLYFWVNEYQQKQQPNAAHLVFITAANGFLLRFNLSRLNVLPTVVNGIDFVIRSFVMPIIVLEQFIVTASFNDDWFAPEAQAFLVSVAGNIISWRLEMLAERYISSDHRLPLEMDYMQDHPEIVRLTSQLSCGVVRQLVCDDGVKLAVSAAIAGTAGYLAYHADDGSNEKAYLATVSQIGITSGTVVLTKAVLERSKRFRSALTVARAQIGKPLTNAFFFPLVRPGTEPKNYFFAFLLGGFLSAAFLMEDRLSRYRNREFRAQAETMAKIEALFPGFFSKVSDSLQQLPSSISTRIKLFFENQPVEVFAKPAHRNTAIAGLVLLAAGIALSFYPKWEYSADALLFAFYALTRKSQLDPAAYCQLSEKELAKNLQTLEGWQLMADKWLCKNPIVVGISYVAAVNLWATTRVDSIPFAVFCSMWGIFQATEARLPHFGPETMDQMKKAFQQAIEQMTSEQRTLMPADFLTYLEKEFDITSPSDHKFTVGVPRGGQERGDIKLIRSEAILLRDMQHYIESKKSANKTTNVDQRSKYLSSMHAFLPMAPSSSEAGPEVDSSQLVELSKLTPTLSVEASYTASAENGLNTAARAASFSLNLGRGLGF